MDNVDGKRDQVFVCVCLWWRMCFHDPFSEASFYAKKIAGRRMADGIRMDPHSDNAASKTLPLGTTAKVTNIDTGQSAVVTIKDRGPYVKGRIVDLSSSTAQKIGITQDNDFAKVQVAPIAVPLPDGSIKAGVAAQNAKQDNRILGRSRMSRFDVVAPIFPLRP